MIIGVDMLTKELPQSCLDVTFTVTKKEEKPLSLQEKSIKSLWDLVNQRVNFTDGKNTYRIHWIQPVGEVCDIGILSDEKFHHNTVLSADREYTAEMFATIFDLQIVTKEEGKA